VLWLRREVCLLEVFNTYCFKIFASESSLDNSKAKGLRDRSFEILCLVGKPQHNIKGNLTPAHGLTIDNESIVEGEELQTAFSGFREGHS
jgi:hypothetical protein